MSDDETGENDTSEGSHAGEKNSGPRSIEVDQARADKVGSSRATVEAAMAELVGGIERPEEPSQPSLMLDEMDEQLALFAGPVRHVADKIAEARRVRGRPKGSQNKNSFRDVVLRMGYRHPGFNLFEMANANPHELALELAAMPRPEGIDAFTWLDTLVTSGRLKRADVVGLVERAQELMRKANAELMPYMESKRPTEVIIDERKLGIMIVGDMRTDRGPDGGFISLTEVEKPE